ncbi:MAG TPA: hypothetical protein VGZ02_17815 [Candidatus Baltobacteraceae bacterium]|jgi:hypothetical protein|nr:hypothetical protein [Candidatus Baltobacteraceae bacterium]
MVSYRTLVFGTIAVISAAAPAYAGQPLALPGPQQQASVATPSQPQALPQKGQPRALPSPVGQQSFITILVNGLGNLERQLLRIHL